MQRSKILAGAILVMALLPPLTVSANTISEDIPITVEVACKYWGAKYDICPELLEAISYRESRWTADVSNGSCKGVMQINEPYYADRIKEFGITDIYDVDSNVHLAADYLAELFETYEDTGAVLGTYHGEKNAAEKAKQGELSSYSIYILKLSEELERVHGK